MSDPTAGDSFEGTDLEQVIAHANLYWTSQGGPGKFAATVDTADVAFAAARG